MLPTDAEISEAQDKDPVWSQRKVAVEQGRSNDKEVQEWLELFGNDFAIQNGALCKSWIKGEGRAAKLVWQTVIPTSLETRVIEGSHACGM